MSYLIYVFVLIFFPQVLFSEGYKAVYDVRYMFFKVGEVNYLLKDSGNLLKVEVTAKAEGIAKLVSGGMVERHKVFLRRVNGSLELLKYVYDMRKKGKRRVKIITVEGDRIRVQDYKWRRGKFKRRKVKFVKLDPHRRCFDPVSLYENVRIGAVLSPFPKRFSLCLITPRGSIVGMEGKRVDHSPDWDPDGFTVIVRKHEDILPFKAGNMYLYFSKNRVLEGVHIENVVFFGDLNVRLRSWKRL